MLQADTRFDFVAVLAARPSGNEELQLAVALQRLPIGRIGSHLSNANIDLRVAICLTVSKYAQEVYGVREGAGRYRSLYRTDASNTAAFVSLP